MDNATAYSGRRNGKYICHNTTPYRDVGFIQIQQRFIYLYPRAVGFCFKAQAGQGQCTLGEEYFVFRISIL